MKLPKELAQIASMILLLIVLGAILNNGDVWMPMLGILEFPSRAIKALYTGSK